MLATSHPQRPIVSSYVTDTCVSSPPPPPPPPPPLPSLLPAPGPAVPAPVNSTVDGSSCGPRLMALSSSLASSLSASASLAPSIGKTINLDQFGDVANIAEFYPSDYVATAVTFGAAGAGDVTLPPPPGALGAAGSGEYYPHEYPEYSVHHAGAPYNLQPDYGNSIVVTGAC